MVNFGYAVFETDKQAHFGDVLDDNLLCVATVVDPRFKLSPLNGADRRRRALEATVRAMETTTVRRRPTSQRQQYPRSTRHQSRPHRSIQSCCRRDGNWIRQSHRHQLRVRCFSRQDWLRRELELYMKVPAIPRAECPLSWWTKNKATYPSVESRTFRPADVSVRTFRPGRFGS